MAAARLNMTVKRNGTWRKTIRYKQAAPTTQEPNRRVAIDLTGWQAKLQAKERPTDDPLFTISTYEDEDPEAVIPTLDSTGVISWTLNVSLLSVPDNALFELVLIDPDGNPEPVLEGQLTFESGIVDVVEP